MRYGESVPRGSKEEHLTRHVIKCLARDATEQLGRAHAQNDGHDQGDGRNAEPNPRRVLGTNERTNQQVNRTGKQTECDQLQGGLWSIRWNGPLCAARTHSTVYRPKTLIRSRYPGNPHELMGHSPYQSSAVLLAHGACDRVVDVAYHSAPTNVVFNLKKKNENVAWLLGTMLLNSQYCTKITEDKNKTSAQDRSHRLRHLIGKLTEYFDRSGNARNRFTACCGDGGIRS